MQSKPKRASPEVVAKATHHHRGVGFSTAPEIRLVTQSKLRLFRTSGTRASGRSTEDEASPAITSGAVVAPSIYDFLPNDAFRTPVAIITRLLRCSQPQSRRHPASLDSDYECARDNSCGFSRSDTRGADNFDSPL